MVLVKVSIHNTEINLFSLSINFDKWYEFHWWTNISWHYQFLCFSLFVYSIPWHKFLILWSNFIFCWSNFLKFLCTVVIIPDNCLQFFCFCLFILDGFFTVEATEPMIELEKDASWLRVQINLSYFFFMLSEVTFNTQSICCCKNIQSTIFQFNLSQFLFFAFIKIVNYFTVRQQSNSFLILNPGIIYFQTSKQDTWELFSFTIFNLKTKFVISIMANDTILSLKHWDLEWLCQISWLLLWMSTQLNPTKRQVCWVKICFLSLAFFISKNSQNILVFEPFIYWFKFRVS